jgi:PTH2 family peptidyl-tRNA hydrolase
MSSMHLGTPWSRAELALFFSGVAVGAATLYMSGWLFQWLRRDHEDEDEDSDEEYSDSDDDEDQPLQTTPVRDDYDAEALDEPYKMLLIFNMELYKMSSKTGEMKSVKMSAGKAAAQSGHATLGAYRRGKKHCPNAVRDWLQMGQMKITVKCQTVDELLKLQKDCSAAGLNTYLIRDAGHTEIEPGSRTVLAVGPAPASAMNKFTGHLKPY